MEVTLTNLCTNTLLQIFFSQDTHGIMFSQWIVSINSSITFFVLVRSLEIIFFSQTQSNQHKNHHANTFYLILQPRFPSLGVQISFISNRTPRCSLLCQEAEWCVHFPSYWKIHFEIFHIYSNILFGKLFFWSNAQFLNGVIEKLFVLYMVSILIPCQMSS